MAGWMGIGYSFDLIALAYGMEWNGFELELEARKEMGGQMMAWTLKITESQSSSCPSDIDSTRYTWTREAGGCQGHGEGDKRPSIIQLSCPPEEVQLQKDEVVTPLSDYFQAWSSSGSMVFFFRREDEGTPVAYAFKASIDPKSPRK